MLGGVPKPMSWLSSRSLWMAASFDARPSHAIPIDNLCARPEQRILSLANVGDHLTKIFQAVRRPHNVGVHNQRHYASRLAGVMAQLFKLIDGPLCVF